MTINSLDEDLATNQSITGLPSSSLTRAPLSSQQTRYQTKAFTTRLTINPLVAAASPLLNLASQLRSQSKMLNYQQLHESICHEVKVLENKTINQGYQSQIILAARYLLCALIDEIILTSPSGGQESKWKQYSLLNTFQRETWGGERFFTILESSAEQPKLYLDLLELGYLCLSLGYQGKYAQPKKLHDLALFIDNLYDVIRQQRGEISKRLLISPNHQSTSSTKRWWLPPTWLTACVATGILVAIFLPYHQKLDKLSNPVKQAIKQIVHSQPLRN